MGELRACLLPVWALRSLLRSGPANRERVLELAASGLAPGPRPEPLGPIYTRVPGAPRVRDDEPSPDDVDRLLGPDAVPPDRLRATWRLVEALAAAMAAATTRTMTGRPTGLAPLGLALPEPDGLVTGSWSLDQAGAQPSLSGWLADAVAQVPAGSGTPDVIVFWEPGATG